MPKFRLIADDYGLGEGHDRVMRGLLASGYIDAVSVLVESCSPASATALSAVAPHGAIGLHVNLTFSPFGTPPRPGRRRLLIESLLGRGGGRARAAVAHQRKLFAELFGRCPDFYDGHEHVHSFPSVRPAVLSAAAEDVRPVRSMVPLAAPRGLKARTLAWLGGGVARAAARNGVDSNWRFGGVLPLDKPDMAIARLGTEIGAARAAAAGAPGDIWIMVHPGDADDPVQIPGHPPRLRAMEAQLLADQPSA